MEKRPTMVDDHEPLTSFLVSPSSSDQLSGTIKKLYDEQHQSRQERRNIMCGGGPLLFVLDFASVLLRVGIFGTESKKKKTRPRKSAPELFPDFFIGYFVVDADCDDDVVVFERNHFENYQ